MRIYVASSWRNNYQPGVVDVLREAGHEVYDFKNPPNKAGFGWEQINKDWQQWNIQEYCDALDHQLAIDGFHADMSALQNAELTVLVLPSGRSASWEYGYSCARTGRPGIVHMPETMEPELMYRGALFTDHLAAIPLAAHIWAAGGGQFSGYVPRPFSMHDGMDQDIRFNTHPDTIYGTEYFVLRQRRVAEIGRLKKIGEALGHRADKQLFGDPS